MRATLALAILMAAATGPAAAQPIPAPGGQRMAYFQAANIFHSGLRGTHTVALTFDDGPNLRTPAVLDALKAQKVKATFFIVGTMATRYPAILKRIAREGHLLANHSATHPVLGRRYVRHPDLLLAEIRQVDDQIAPLMPEGSGFYFRAPYGIWQKAHAEILNADPVLRKYVGPVYWDVGGDTTFDDEGYILSSADWNCWRRKWTPETCANGYLREIRRKNGGVVLMHCIGTLDAELVEAVVPALIEEGYTFVRMDQASGYKRYETPPSLSRPVFASAAATRAGGR